MSLARQAAAIEAGEQNRRTKGARRVPNAVIGTE